MKCFGSLMVLLCLNAVIVFEVKAKGKVCERLFLEIGVEMESFPFVQLEGVYALNYDETGYDENGNIVGIGPVFKHEERNYFYPAGNWAGWNGPRLYFTHRYGKISNGESNGRYYNMNVWAELLKNYTTVKWEDFHADPMYWSQKFISRWSWFYYDSYRNRITESENSSAVKFKCIPDDFFKCSTDQLFYNMTITLNNQTLHIDTTDYFSAFSGAVVNYRQVYKHSKKSDWFLFYHSDYWRVGPDYNKSDGVLRSFGSPFRPEYLQNNWEYWNGSAWIYFTDPVGLKCRGLKRTTWDGTSILCRHDNPCQNHARCHDNTLTNETVCLCPDTYKGLTCNIPVKTCNIDQYLWYLYVDYFDTNFEVKAVNSIVQLYCRDNYSPRRIFKQCQYNGTATYWSGDDCYWDPLPKTTTTAIKPKRWSRSSSRRSVWSTWSSSSIWASRSRTRQREGKKFNFDDYDWAEPVLLTVVCLLQVTIPLVHMFIGLWRDKSACRILSIHAYISFICWLTYYSACAYTKCAKHGKVLGDFGIMSIVMVVLSYLYILIESCLSSENQYVSNILKDESAVQIINALKRATPTRLMMIECWHMETRKRTVYCEDAKGKMKSKTKTYQEKVVTHTEETRFPFGYCEDIFDSLGPKFDQSGVTRLKLLQDVDCGDQETTAEFLKMREDMIDRNKHRDVNIDFSYEDRIPGFKKRICAYVDIKFKPWWMNMLCFWLASLLLCSWPFRLLFRWKTTKADVTIKKRLYLRRPDNVPALSIPAALQDGIGFINKAHLPVFYDGSRVHLGYPATLQKSQDPADSYLPSYNEAFPTPPAGYDPPPASPVESSGNAD